MGLDLAIKGYVVRGELKEINHKTEHAPPEMWLAELPSKRTDEVIGDTAVTSPLHVAVTYDICVKIHQMATGDYDSPGAYLDRMLQVVQRSVHPPSVKLVVLIVDHPDATPPEKHEEWKTRDDKAAKDRERTGALPPYPAGCTVTRAGVFDASGTKLPFDAGRLVGNRYLRNELFCTENIQATLKSMGTAGAATLLPFVVDRCCQNISFFDNTDSKVGDPDNAEVATSCAKEIYRRWYGEADIGQVFWAVALMKHGYFVCVTSTDSDFLATSCSLLLPETVAALNITDGQFDDLLGWRCDPKKQGWAGKEGDILLVLKALRLRCAEISITPSQFMTACVMMGNDFIKKDDISHNISLGTFFLFLKAQTARHQKAGTTHSDETAGWPIQALHSPHNCASLLISMYAFASTQKLGPHVGSLLEYGLSLNAIQERMDRRGQGTFFKLPVGDKLVLAKQRAQMAAFYWRVAIPKCRAVYLGLYQEAMAALAEKDLAARTPQAVVELNNKKKYKGAPQYMKSQRSAANGLRGATHDDSDDDAVRAP